MNRRSTWLAAACLLGLVFESAPSRAQLTVEPEGLTVSLPQHATETHTVTLTNAGAEALSFCLSFDRPLQRIGRTARLSADALGEACGPYGEVLALVDESAIEAPSWNPYGLTMTHDGRLFAAESSGFSRETYELTPSLEVVRAFEHPHFAELTSFSGTRGVTYNADTGSLWWLNIEASGFTVARALLLEGDLDGVPTGRRIELPVAEDAPPPAETGYPSGLGYDPVRQQFFFTDAANDDIWAVDTLGNTVAGYPVQPEAYPTAYLASLDAHGGSFGLRLELRATLPDATNPQRLLVIGARGGDTAPEAEPLETLLPPSNPNAPPGVPRGEPLRSRLDPNGVLYYPWGTFDDAGVVAIRPHPLSPSWLVVEAWDGMLAAGDSQSIELTFRPGGRAIGEYTAVLQAFEAVSGAVVEVPLVLSVTEGTNAVDEAAPEEAVTLTVYPNPVVREATVALTLARASEVSVAVYDVLGRRVAVLHDGNLEAGTHTFGLAGRALPSGVYLVRVGGREVVAAQRVSVVR